MSGTRYFVEVADASGDFFECHRPLFDSMAAACMWAFVAYPHHQWRVMARRVH